jgi:selenocysteine lyase/cysteine desulfurase
MNDLKTNDFTDLRVVRELFPITRTHTYLNAAAIGPLPLPTRQMLTELDSARADCQMDYDVEKFHHQRARKAIAQLIGATEEEIALTPNTSSGLTRAAWSLPLSAGDELLIPGEEFPAPVYSVLRLRQKGIDVRFIDCQFGLLTPEKLKAAITPKSKALFVSWVNFKSGARQPLAELSLICHQQGLIMVVDGIQGVGGMDCDVQQLGIDVLAGAGPKWLLSPMGIGFLYIHRPVQKELSPLPWGWLSVQRDDDHPFEDLTNYQWKAYQDARRFELGTIPHTLCGAMATSVDLLYGLGMKRVEEHIMSLNNLLYAELLKRRWSPVLAGRDAKYRSNVAVFKPKDFHRLQEVFAKEKIVATLRAGLVRIGAHIYNNEDDIRHLITICDSYSV